MQTGVSSLRSALSRGAGLRRLPACRLAVATCLRHLRRANFRNLRARCPLPRPGATDVATFSECAHRLPPKRN